MHFLESWGKERKLRCSTKTTHIDTGTFELESKFESSK